MGENFIAKFLFYYTHFEITFYLANWLSLSSMIYTIYEF